MTERCLAFDRQAILLPAQFQGQDVIIPQLVGFLGENGIEYQISVERAIQLGLLAQGEIKAILMTLEEQLHEQRTRRMDEACGHCSVGDNCRAREEATRLSNLYTQRKA